MSSNGPRCLIFASGGRDGGGSGFRKLVENTLTPNPILSADIIGVVSDWENGGVKKHADNLGIPFVYMPSSYDAENHWKLKKDFNAHWMLLSGWLKFVRGLPTQQVINIHPGPLPKFGGAGMYGHHVHEAVVKAFKNDEVQVSAVTMHFVDEKAYDYGPKLFEFPVYIDPDDDADSLGARVKQYEHGWQSWVTNLVIHQKIVLNKDGNVLVPEWYFKMPFCPKMSYIQIMP